MNGWRIKDLEEMETVLFRNPDYTTAIVGISDDFRVIYDHDKMIEYLMETENMNQEDAVDFVENDTMRCLSYMSGNRPIMMFPIEQE